MAETDNTLINVFIKTPPNWYSKTLHQEYEIKMNIKSFQPCMLIKLIYSLYSLAKVINTIYVE